MKINKGDYVIEIDPKNSDSHFDKNFIKITKMGLLGDIEYYDGLLHRSEFEEEINTTISRKYFNNTNWITADEFLTALKPELKIYKCSQDITSYYLSVASSNNFELLVRKTNSGAGLAIVTKADLLKEKMTTISEKEYFDAVEKEGRSVVQPILHMKEFMMEKYKFSKKLVSAPKEKFQSYIRFELLKHIAPEYKEKFKQELYQNIKPEEAQL